MRTLKDVARRLGLQWAAAAGLDASAFAAVGATEWSNAWQGSLLKAATSLKATVATCRSARGALLLHLGVELPGSENRPGRTGRPGTLSAGSRGPTAWFVFGPDGPAALESAQKATALIAGYTEAARGLVTRHPPETLGKIRLEHLASEWKKANAAVWPLSVFKRKAVQQELSALGVPDLDLDADLDRLRQMLADQLAVERLGEQAQTVPGWNGMATTAVAVEQTAAGAARLRLLVAWVADNTTQGSALRSALQSPLSERTEELSGISPLQQAAMDYSTTYGSYSNALAEFGRLAASPEAVGTQDVLGFAEQRHTADREHLRAEPLDCMVARAQGSAPARVGAAGCRPGARRDPLP